MLNKVPTVVITRPIKQAMLWAEKLQSEDIQSQIISLMEIKSFQNDSIETDSIETEQVRSIKNCILDLDLFQKIIFVSQNAVEQGMEWIEAYWPQIPQGVDFFAIGETTANLLRGYGVDVQDLSILTKGDMTSENLLLAEGLQNVANEKILIVRGVGGRGHLAEGLIKRGALVKYCEVYQRQIPASAKDSLGNWLGSINQESNNHYLLAFHSGEALQNFQLLLTNLTKEISIELHQLLEETFVLVPSKRLELEAINAGFKHCIVAANATDESMTLAVKQFFRSN
jgi:uroporphyrinogen-III synthase